MNKSEIESPAKNNVKLVVQTLLLTTEKLSFGKYKNNEFVFIIKRLYYSKIKENNFTTLSLATNDSEYLALHGLYIHSRNN